MVVYFVHHQKDRLVGPAQGIGHGFVQIGDAGNGIHHKDERVGFFQRDQHLLFDLLFKNIIAAGYKAAGVDHVERFARPFRHPVLAVAGHAADVVYNGLALLEQPVEKSAFTHVGPSYYCDCKSGHGNKFKSSGMRWRSGGG